MNNRYLAIYAALSLICACTKDADSGESENGPVAEMETPADVIYRHGVQAVYFSEEMTEYLESDLVDGQLATKSSDLSAFSVSNGIKSMRRVFPVDDRYEERTRKRGMHRWYYVEYDETAMLPTKASEAFAGMPGVEYSEPVRRIRSLEDADPYAAQQWALYHPDGMDINVRDVWHKYTAGSSDVIVAVVDSGVNLEHEDLKGNTLEADVHKSRNFVYPGYVLHPDDHGTHVAGIIAAVRNNGIGIAGIAGGDASKNVGGVKIMSCQILDTDDSGKSISKGDAEAIKYAADNGAVICQNSWGYYYDRDGDGKLTGDELKEALSAKIDGPLRSAVDYFIDCAGCDNDGNQLPDSPMKGGIVIFAAGNDNIENGAPANYDRILSVASTTKGGGRSSFSNYGEWVDICAPGSDIYSTAVNGYKNMSGTSMACPQVSGVAALVVSYRGGQGFTSQDLMECLISGARKDFISSTVPVGPFVDALGAITYGISTPPDVIPQIGISSSSNNIETTLSIEGNNLPYGINVYLSKNRSSIENLDPRHPANDVIVIRRVVSDSEDAGHLLARKDGLDFETEYFAAAVAFNYGPVFGEMSNIVSVKTGKNSSPEITASIPVDNIILRPSQYVNFQVTICDPDGHPFSTEIETAGPAESWLATDQGFNVTINAIREKSGSYVSRLKATDKYGASASLEVSYTILENEAPRSVRTMENLLLYGTSAKAELDLGTFFTDPDGDPLTYDVAASSAKVAHVSASEGRLYVTARGLGLSDLTVTVKDPSGAQTSQTFRLLVRDPETHTAVYPNPVKDVLNIATDADRVQADISIFSQAGKEICRTTEYASAFEPAQIDMSNMAPGQYSVRIRFDGKTYVHHIVKL